MNNKTVIIQLNTSILFYLMHSFRDRTMNDFLCKSVSYSIHVTKVVLYYIQI